MRRIYATVAGQYSDYVVEALFERREDAAAYANAHNRARASDPGTVAPSEWTGCPDANAPEDDDKPWCYRVEEFELYPAGEVPIVEAET